MHASIKIIRNLIIVIGFGSSIAVAANFKPIEIHRGYKHDRFVTKPQHHIFNFRAYMASVAGKNSEPIGIPLWVAYQMKRFEGTLGKGPNRPSKWITIRKLARQSVVPYDATYRYSRAFRARNKNWYVRGHLCMKQHAWRLGPNADWNTHTVANAVPQRDQFNSGIWQDLERKTAGWADRYGSIWIVTGPVFFNQRPREWLGERHKGEKLIAIPDALFKIVIRESSTPNRPHVLAFIYPQTGQGYRKGPFDHRRYLRSVDEIEKLTGLDFLTSLPDAEEGDVEMNAATELWN